MCITRLHDLKRSIVNIFVTESILHTCSCSLSVCGRGQLHLTVLIENMRREGFELMVGPPTVIDRVIDGVKCEPFEQVDVTVPNDYSSAVVDMLNKRKGEMLSMGPAEGKSPEKHSNPTLTCRTVYLT